MKRSLVLVMLVLGCRDSTAPTLTPCAGPVTVTLQTRTLQPTFSWSPNCLTDQVSVAEEFPPSVGGDQMKWILMTRRDEKGSGAPLRYGAVPLSMEELLHAQPLAPTHTYHVRVYGSGSMVGEAYFALPYPPD